MLYLKIQEMRTHRILVGKLCKRRDLLRDLAVIGRIILKRIVEKLNVKMSSGFD